VCDPSTPVGQTPYIWRIPKNDRARAFKRSPEKSFRSSDRYTIHRPGGAKNLAIERALGQLENDFVATINRLKKNSVLTSKERTTLCWFTSAMFARTERTPDSIRQLLRGAQDQAARLERRRNASPTLSEELNSMRINTAPDYVAIMTPKIADVLSNMSLTILVTGDNAGFITSDEPCVQCIPYSRQRPFIGDPNVEFTMPLTPLHLALFTWRQQRDLYRPINEDVVDEANSRAVFNCNREFISWKGMIRDCWFSA